MIRYRFLFPAILFLILLPGIVFSQVEKSGDTLLRNPYVIDSTGWVSMRDRLIVGCEAGLYNSWFSFENIKDNHTADLEDLNDWMFKTGYTPLSNSYYIASAYGRFFLFSHPVLTNSGISGKSPSRYVSYGYSHMIKKVNVGLSYRNISGYKRENRIDYPVIHVDDTLRYLSARDYRLTLEFIPKYNLNYKKYGFSSLYFPIKAAACANVILETSYFKLTNGNSGIIPFYTWNYTTGNFIIDPTGYMKFFSILTQSLNFHLAAVLPILKRTDEKPRSLFVKADYVYGLNFYKYKNVSFSQGVVDSGVRMAMANSYGSFQLIYADKKLHLALGLTARTIKFNELERKNEIHMQFFTSYLFFNAGFRIPFKKEYDKIYEFLH